MSLSICAACIATLSLTSAALAGQTCVSAQVPLTPLQPLPFEQSVSIPRFGSEFGVLTGVRIQLAAHIEGGFGIESLDGFANALAVHFSASALVKRPDGTLIVFAAPSQALDVTLTPYDGVTDFMGPSGDTFTGLSVDAIPSPSVVLSSAADLALFSGPASNPGVVALRFNSAGTASITGGNVIIAQFTTYASATITVCYEYEPAVTSYCAGTGLTCPCGFGGFFGAGCRHSGGPLGSYLAHSGLASTSADSFVLSATALPPGTSALFFQGTTRVNGGTGLAFGDGLLCAGGNVTRLAVEIAAADSAHHPALGDVPVSAAGGVSAGDVRTYQAWYRDAAAFCTSETFNLTQALEVVWVQ